MSNDETQPGAAPTPAAAFPVAYAPAPPPRNRGRLILAGGALGIALVAGSGGFALGHVTADDGRDGPGRFGGPGGGFRDGFPGRGPLQGGPMQGGRPPG